MGKNNTIDNLFKSGLAGGEAGQYSEAAWHGAKTMLDQHYRRLFWKKAIAVSTPVVLLLGFTCYYFLNPTSTPVLEVGQHSELPVKATQTQVREQKPQTQSLDARLLEADEKLHAAADEPAMKQTPEQETEQGTGTSGVQAVAGQNNLGAKASANEIPGSQRQDQPTKEPETGLLSVSGNMALSVSDNLRPMPVFTVHQLGQSETMGLIERDKLKKEALMSLLRKFELRAGAGAIAGISLPNALGKVSPGLYGDLILRYHFNHRVYGQTGAVLHLRQSAGNVLLEANGNYLEPAYLAYLDVPVEIGYRFGARHSLRFGMAFSALTLATDRPAKADEPGGSPVIIAAQSKAGFAGLDVGGLLAYEFQLTQRVNLSAQLRYGLFDITDNQFFQTSTVDDRNHQFRLGCSYRLINR